MKKNTNSVNKMIKSFDKELRNLLLNDLKVARVAGKGLIKNINHIGGDQLMIA